MDKQNSGPHRKCRNSTDISTSELGKSDGSFDSLTVELAREPETHNGAYA